MNVLTPNMPPNPSAAASPGLEFRAVDPLQGPAWDRLVGGHAEAGVFHGSAWARVLVRSYGHRPFYGSLHRGGRLVALLPLMEVNSVVTGRRGVCLPFADHAGFLFFEGGPGPEVVELVSRLARERGWKHVEVRGGAGLPERTPASATYFVHQLDLRPGLERVHQGFDSSVRRALRRAGQEELSVEIRSDGEAMRLFFALHTRTRRRHGLPPQPERFFRVIQQELLEPGLGAVVLARRGERPVAAAVFFHAGGQALYKFGASDERLSSSRANNLVMWEGIQWLAGRGASSLHFGRTSCSQDGLRRYKRGWGAAESLMAYHSLAFPSSTWTCEGPPPASLHTRLFSRLPLSLNRLLGAALYPHLD